MAEPRNDMFPDVVNQPELDSEVVQTPPAEPIVPDKPAAPAVQSPPSKNYEELYQNQLKATQEERRMRKEAEQRAKEIELSTALSNLDENDLSEEGKALKREVGAVREELKNLKVQREEEKVFTQYPDLLTSQEEFDQFRSSYPGVALDRVARLFLSEKGTLGTPERKGLEKPSASVRNLPDPDAYSASDIDRLMKNSPREFIKKIRSGEIDPDKIK